MIYILEKILEKVHTPEHLFWFGVLSLIGLSIITSGIVRIIKSINDTIKHRKSDKV